ncbi:type IV secretory system conjugative DNA transfer family protein [Oscillochloris sp. ZM17-4]|uniref:type IV secretory system conjugative DNA transfer family protein n=1 Tax=Oscillochloris sp. ZM17-4 TaxID=2866714 RepID=UPI001C72C0B3|nr:type IV secretory system conjugative DNA transfer family protein [Oscillochloris sp. ZM17-4]MBX0328254.1 type IV secretory system conjugative DNA transfer family protein [Oscillochloris sp. ZM17-4]
MQRRHMIIIGAPGDGKTQTQITFMVRDIARGDQVIWASTNLALYHSRDQRTDLRPITHLFEHTRDALEIMAVLLWASAEVDRRMSFYHEDMPHGDPVVIYVDELGGLYRRFGDLLVNAMRNIGEQGRKVDVFLGLVAHNALKESTGLDMALKPLFQTRLLGNVDQATWTAMVGPGIKLRGVPDGRGLWNMPDRRNQIHEVQVARPTAWEITDLARRMPLPDWEPILEQAAPYLERLRATLAVSTKKVTETLAAAAGELAGAPSEPEAPEPTEVPWAPSALHLQVRELVQAATPEIHRLVREEGLSLAKAQELTQTSNRALARRLGLGSGGGAASMKIGEAIKEWEENGGVRLFDIPDAPPASRPRAVPERGEREERGERVNAA